MTSQDNDPQESPRANLEADRGALSALMREVQATHLLVWSTNSGGLLTSMKIPVTDCAQQVRLASRILGDNLDEAAKMVQSASNQFDNAAQRWASQARQSEDKLRAERAAAKLNDAKARHNGIRTRIGPVQSLFRRALQSLNDANMRRQREQAEE